MRINHYLRKNASSESPKRWLFVDSEAFQTVTKEVIHGIPVINQELRLWTAIYSDGRKRNYRKEFSGTTTKEFHQLLDSLLWNNSKLHVVAHNMGYDYTILKMDTYLASFDIGFRVIKPIFIIKAKRDKSTIALLSSTNWFKQSLKDLGSIFGMEKIDVDMEHLDALPDDQVLEYCMQDSRILEHIMTWYRDFVLSNDLGNFKPTIAGQAFTAFRHKFLDHSLLIHTYADVLGMETDSYHGGRCEAFQLGEIENVYKLDINSMYPFVMKNHKYPTKPNGHYPFEASLDTVRAALDKGYFVLAECDLDMKQPVIGIKEEKLVFPIGHIRTILCSPELEYILKNRECGTVKKVHRMITYEQADIFSRYVDFFYDLKVNTKEKAFREMAKIFLNSLYGKFGQKEGGTFHAVNINTVEYENEMAILKLIDRQSCGEYVLLAGVLYRADAPLDGSLANDSMPIIAATVTSYARIYLWKIMQLAGDGNYFYCDTDSLFVNREGFDNLNRASLIQDDILGKMKVEAFGKAVIHGCKSYQFNDEIKQKGVKKNAELLPDGHYRQYQFITGATRYHRNTPDGIVQLVPMVKSLSGKYDKGIVRKTGQVKPFSLSEW